MFINKLIYLSCITFLLSSILASCVIFNKNTAKMLAEEYLQTKYKSEMKYLHVNYTWFDPQIYYVFFSSIDDPELKFHVIIPYDLSIPIEKKSMYGILVPDNYLLEYFSICIKRLLSSEIQEIWDSNTVVSVHIDDNSLSRIQIPEEINENMTANEMEPYIKYSIFINIDLLFNDKIIEEEARNILNVFKIFKNKEYKPNRIIFWYRTKQNEYGKSNFTYENWFDYKTLEQVIEILKEK